MVGSLSRTSTFSSGSISSGLPKLVKSPANTNTSASSRTLFNWSCKALNRAGVKWRSAVAATLILFSSGGAPLLRSRPSNGRLVLQGLSPIFLLDVRQPPIFHIDRKHIVVDQAATETCVRIGMLNFVHVAGQQILPK